MDSKNEWLLLLASFTEKFGLVLKYNLQNGVRNFFFKEMGLGIFEFW